MGDESRYRYRRDDAATGSGLGSRQAQAAGGDRAAGRDPLAELARLMDHDPFDDFDGLPPEQQSRSAAPQQGAPQQVDPRRAPAQRYAPPAPPAPAQRLAPPQPPRAALQPPSRPAAVESDYDEDDDEAWNDTPVRQPPVPVRAAPTYAPEPASRAPQGYGQSGYAPPSPSYAPAPRPADPRAADVRLGYGSLARDAAAARAVPPPPPAQDYDDYDDEYDDDGVADPRQADPRYTDPRVRSAGYAQSPAPQAYGRADARQDYRQETRQDPRQDARQDPRHDTRYAEDRRAPSGQPAQQAARYEDETEEAAYAYSAARREDDYDYDDYDDRYDPEYADDGYMPPHGDEMYEPEPRRSRGRMALLLGASLVGLVVAGVAGVFAYNMAVGRSGLMSSSSTPPVIKADSAPAKTTTPASATADGQKSIYDRVGGPATAGNERMVPREEQPVDVTSAARPPADSAPAQQPMQATQNLTEPKRVRTMTVRADGSVTPGVPSSAVSAYAPNQNPIPVGLPQPNPVTTVSASAPADAAASTSPSSTAAGTYVVQVASQRSESDALGSWKALQAKYPNLLGSYKATVKKADLGDKGIYYRAQVGPFASRDQANDLCQSLRAQGGDCVVTKL